MLDQNSYLQMKRFAFSISLFVATLSHLAYAERGPQGDGPVAILVAQGDNYFIHLVRAKPKPLRGVQEFPTLTPRPAVLAHTSRSDGRMQPLFAEGAQGWQYVGGINRTGHILRTIEDVKADQHRLYLLVRTRSSTTMQGGPTSVSVSLSMRAYWLEDGQLIGDHTFASQSVGEGEMPEVQTSALGLTTNGVSCLERTWIFDGKVLKEND